MRERAGVFIDDPEGERLDAEQLHRMLKGGWSIGSKRRYIGLSQRVLARIAEIFTLPKPMGWSSDSRLPGDERRVLYGATNPEADALELANDLAEWLGDDRVYEPGEVDREMLLSLARRATGRALGWLKGRRKYVPENRRVRTVALVRIYLAWLGRECDHRHMPTEGRVRVCPDCGVSTVG